MTDHFNIINKNNKFIIIKNGKPINFPNTDGASLTKEFDNKEDAERYISIVKNLQKTKHR